MPRPAGAAHLRTPREAARPEAGLSSAAAAERLMHDGPIQMPTPAWRQFLAQMVSFFTVVLWIAGGWRSSGPNPARRDHLRRGRAQRELRVVQGRQADHAAARLGELLPGGSRSRDGQRSSGRGLVRDDVALTGGDRGSADLHLVDAQSLLVDTSILTTPSSPGRS